VIEQGMHLGPQRVNDKLDVTTMRFSLLVVTPRQEFIDWLRRFAESDGYKVYFPEQDNVWLIPPLDVFDAPISFDDYVKELKPRLLIAELGQFGATLEDIKLDGSAASFDRLFTLLVRERAFLVTDLTATKPPST
jgi:hypothetical protein